MNYEQTIEYLYNEVPMFSKIGKKAYKADLGRTIALCEHLGHPEKKFKSIHVAGTNGKGSVCNMLAAIFQTNGIRTGLFTSPHIHDFGERIRVNGKKVDKTFIVDFVEKNKIYIEEKQPSFFELTFGMAMEFFATQNLGIVIIETGLGGRLDSTNVILPELSVITNIGYDHMNILGDTLEKIAGEKAGIIKNNIPVVIGETHPKTKDVFIRKAKETDSPIVFADQNFRILDSVPVGNKQAISVNELVTGKTTHYFLDSSAIYEQKNLLTTLQVVAAVAKEFDLKPAPTQKAISNFNEITGFEGRWQIIHTNPTIVLDVGHNTDGFKQIIDQINVIPHDQLHIVLGMVKDKDITGVLNLMPKNAQYYFTNAHIPRALPAKELCDKAAEKNLSGGFFENVNEAINVAFSLARKKDLIVVCGSFFIIGEIDRALILDNTAAMEQ